MSLISDAGTPLLSDPGQLLLDECLKNEIFVKPIPGVSSITAAMSVSGFNDQFLFYGFSQKKRKELKMCYHQFQNIITHRFFLYQL